MVSSQRVLFVSALLVVFCAVRPARAADEFTWGVLPHVELDRRNWVSLSKGQAFPGDRASLVRERESLGYGTPIALIAAGGTFAIPWTMLFAFAASQPGGCQSQYFCIDAAIVAGVAGAVALPHWIVTTVGVVLLKNRAARRAEIEASLGELDRTSGVRLSSFGFDPGTGLVTFGGTF